MQVGDWIKHRDGCIGEIIKIDKLVTIRWTYSTYNHILNKTLDYHKDILRYSSCLSNKEKNELKAKLL